MRLPLLVVFLSFSGFSFLAASAAPQSKELGRRRVEVEVNGKAVLALMSPKEDQILWAENDGGDTEILVANSDGTDVKKLTDNRYHDYDPDWNPEGDRIVFTSTRSGKHQIYSMSSAAGDIKQLTENEYGSRRPMFSSAGHFVWQVLHKRRGKVEPIDVYLRLADSKEESILVEKSLLLSQAWHPDGDVLVVGCVGSIQFINVETNERKTVSFPSIDDRLFAHGARSIQWSPDGQRIVCRIAFVGGRMGDVTIFGDHEVFVIDRDGQFKIFDDLTSAQESYNWIAIK